jgi:hypothetical protein
MDGYEFPNFMKAGTPNKNNDMLTKEALEEMAKQFKKSQPQPLVVHPKVKLKLEEAVQPPKGVYELGDMPGLVPSTVKTNPYVPEDTMYMLAANPMAEMVKASGVAMAKSLEQDIFNSLKVDAASVAYNEPSKEQILHYINKLSNEELIGTLANRMGRSIKPSDRKRILDYIHRNSETLFMVKEDPIFNSQLNPDNFLDVMKAALEKLPGVKATVLLNNYPESASILIKVDHRALDEDELGLISEDIYTTIRQYRVDGLDELEVIYHNREVY